MTLSEAQERVREALDGKRRWGGLAPEIRMVADALDDLQEQWAAELRHHEAIREALERAGPLTAVDPAPCSPSPA